MDLKRSDAAEFWKRTNNIDDADKLELEVSAELDFIAEVIAKECCDHEDTCRLRRDVIDPVCKAVKKLKL